MITASLDKLRRYGRVALAFLHIAVSRGLHGTFGVFFVAMLDAFGWSRGATAGAISLAIVFEGMCLPFAGSLIDRIGGRKTLMLGGLLLAIPPVHFFLPAAHAAAAQTAPPTKVAVEEKRTTDWTVREALTNTAFWLLFIARTLASMGNQVIVTHQIAHAIDVGYGKVFAASIFGLMGVISIF